jgi:tripartite-type tricarboxylate transporter receptor subunit TctC
LNGAVFTLPYDALRDFEPISLVANNPLLIAARKSMPAQDLKQFIAWLKVNMEKTSAGTSGIGSIQHIGGILFQNTTGTRFQFVPYRGGGPAMQDLVAGQIDLEIVEVAESIQQMRAGAIKVYAVAARNRVGIAPDIPTADEAGLPGFYITNWSGLWAPKGTPRNVIGKLNAAVVDALADPEVHQRLADLGQAVFPREQQTPEALGAFHKAEIDKWWPIIKAANIRIE